MATLHGKIAIRDGIVYFATGYALSQEPVFLWRLYRLNVDPRLVEEGWACRSPDSLHDRKIVYLTPSFGMRTELAARMTNPDGSYATGDVQSALTEEEPIPRPKVRTETRWNGAYGRWEKYLKSKGWVPA